MIDDADNAETAAVPEQRMQVPPWVQLVGLPLVVLFGYLFIQASSHAVVIFLIATLVSLLLAPVVRALVATGLPRLMSVLIVFGAFASIVTLATIAVVELTVNQAVEMRTNSDDIADAAVDRIDELQRFADEHGINVDVRDQSVRFVHQLEERSTELSSEALQFGREFVTVLAEAAFNLVLIVVITIYMLLDAQRIGRRISSALPPSIGVDQLFGRMQRSLLRYTIGQTAASIVMGVSAAIGLWLLDVLGLWDQGAEYAMLFGTIVALTEFAPSIGPVLGAIPPIVTAAFDSPTAAISVAILFLLLHQIEGHIVIPKLMGAAIAVHPLLVIFGILAGAQIMGLGGILLALPILAVGRELVMFVRERVALGRWATPMPGSALGAVAVVDASGAPGGLDDVHVSGAAARAPFGAATAARVASTRRRIADRWARRGADNDPPPTTTTPPPTDGPDA